MVHNCVKNLFTPALDKEPKLHHYNEIFII